jgi:hypothetical protein
MIGMIGKARRPLSGPQSPATRSWAKQVIL